MTGSITPSCASVVDGLRRVLVALLLLLPVLVWADGRVRYAEVVGGDGGYVVNADFDLELNPRLVDVLTRGVSLHFNVEFTLERSRRFWFDEVVAERKLNYRLSYHTITRTYRLSVGTLHRSFDTLDAALRTMLRIRSWRIATAEDLTPGLSYNAALRLRHDTGMLPRPFQVTAIGSRDWSVGTDWLRWTFLAGGAR